jgi:hypothetical protein
MMFLFIVAVASEWEADNPNRRDQTVRYLQRYVDEIVNKGTHKLKKALTAPRLVR